jgi:cytochrome c553
MTTIDEIKAAISHLSDTELRELRAWYDQFDAELWDAQMEEDVAAGRLDALAEEALHAFRNGKTTEL